MTNAQPFLELLEKIGPEGMSSDEEEDDQDDGMLEASTARKSKIKRYLIYDKEWRSDSLCAFLSKLDEVHFKNLRRFSTARHRVRPQEALYSFQPQVPIRLPRNCYSFSFLNKLNPQALLITSVMEEIDFSKVVFMRSNDD